MPAGTARKMGFGGKVKWYALGESNPSFQNENLAS